MPRICGTKEDHRKPFKATTLRPTTRGIVNLHAHNQSKNGPAHTVPFGVPLDVADGDRFPGQGRSGPAEKAQRTIQNSRPRWPSPSGPREATSAPARSPRWADIRTMEGRQASTRKRRCFWCRSRSRVNRIGSQTRTAITGKHPIQQGLDGESGWQAIASNPRVPFFPFAPAAAKGGGRGKGRVIRGPSPLAYQPDSPTAQDGGGPERVRKWRCPITMISRSWDPEF
jgi:hypothetical protein